MSHTLATGADAPPLSLLARFVGIITSPKDTYRSVVAHPRWFGMLALTTTMVAVLTVLPMTTEEGKAALLDTQVRQMESFGMEVTDQQYEAMSRAIDRAPYFSGIGVLVVTPIWLLILSGILYAVFNAGLGGDATFKQLFAVIAHSGVISALSALFTGPLNYFRGSMDSASNLGVLVSNLVEEGSFVARLLGLIDVFIIWSLIVLAIGLGVLYRRKTQPIAAGLLVAYAVIAVAIAAILSIVGGRG